MKHSFAEFLTIGMASVAVAMPYQQRSESSLVARFGECKTTADCAAGSCCSKFGFCGTGPEFCATDCDTPAAPPAGGNDNTSPPPASSPPAAGGSDSGSAGGTTATCTARSLFKGDGSVGAGWPSDTTWVNFDTLWNLNLVTLGTSCTQFGAANNSPDEIASIKSAVQSIAASSGVDSRFILATVLQESKGCVRVPTTSFSVPNPGLMQDHDGAFNCVGVNPCSDAQVTGMIQEGTTGTPSGEGLKQILARTPTTGSQQVYQAARIYNSGSIPANGDLSDGGATSSYASDIAGRLGGCVF